MYWPEIAMQASCETKSMGLERGSEWSSFHTSSECTNDQPPSSSSKSPPIRPKNACEINESKVQRHFMLKFLAPVQFIHNRRRRRRRGGRCRRRHHPSSPLILSRLVSSPLISSYLLLSRPYWDSPIGAT